MVQLPAYAVDGGMVPAAMARRATHALSSGANGVVGIHDLKVNALPTPGAGVQISRGSALAAMRTSGAHEMETYVISQDSTFNLDVPPTGGSARTDFIIARVMDWHFTGEEPPADPTTALYWEFARVGTLNGISYPFVPLARIAIPANRASIMGAMITDIREVAIPRRERHVFTYDLSLGEEDQLGDPNGEAWPDIGQHWFHIPEWAVRANVVITFAQVRVPAGSTRVGHMNARIRTDNMDADVYTRTTKYEAGNPPNSMRQTYVAAGPINIPAQMRGRDAYVYTRGNWQSGSGSYLSLDSGSAVVIDIEFMEVAG